MNLHRCRVCLARQERLISLYEPLRLDGAVTFLNVIVKFFEIEIATDDNKPQKICTLCADIIKDMDELNIKCKRSQEILNREVNNSKVENLEKEEKIESVVISDSDPEELGVEPDVFINLEDEEELNDPKDLPKIFAYPIKCIFPTNNQNKSNRKEKLNVKTNNLDLEECFTNSKAVSEQTCNICGWIFKTNEEMIRHREKHVMKYCKFCNFECITAKELTKHNFEIHADKKAFQCKECKKKFFDKTKLNSHMLTHSAKKFTCEMCGVSFTLKGNLTQHQTIHTGEKPYKCNECGKRFTQTSTLKLHLAVHYDIRKFVCDICGHRFLRRPALNVHYRRHLGEKPYDCDVCGKGFTTLTEMKKHKEEKHGGERNFECEVCKRKFLRRTHLKTHMRTHTGEKPYICEFCGKGFSQAVCMRTHVKSYHNVDPETKPTTILVKDLVH